MFSRRSFLNYLLLLGAYSIRPEIATADTDVLAREGDIAPDFKLAGTNPTLPQKQYWELSELKGKWVVLYFYPKDYTNGCTIEAKGFKDLNKDFQKQNALVVGISADSVEEHQSFCNDESLGFTLLSDNEGEVSKIYESWEAPYSLRNTFLIDQAGVLRHKWTNVRPFGHAKDVLSELKRLKQYV